MTPDQKTRAGLLRRAIESVNYDADGWPDTEQFECRRADMKALEVYSELRGDPDPFAENWCDYAGAFLDLVHAVLDGDRDLRWVRAFRFACRGLAFPVRKWAQRDSEGKPLPRFKPVPTDTDPADAYPDDWGNPPEVDSDDWHRWQSAQRN